MLLLSQMPTMISPQHDDGVVSMFASFHRLEHTSNLSVGKADRGQIGLNRFAPLAVGDDVLVIPARRREVLFAGRVIDFPGELLPKRRYVAQVSFPGRRELDAIERMQVEVLLGNIPG